MKLKDEIISEVPKYKKRSKAKGLKRAKHKHEYIEALFEHPMEDSFGGTKIRISKMQYCSICGRINHSGILEMEKVPNTSYYKFLSPKEVREKYKDLPLYKIDYKPQKFISIDQLGE